MNFRCRYIIYSRRFPQSGRKGMLIIRYVDNFTTADAEDGAGSFRVRYLYVNHRLYALDQGSVGLLTNYPNGGNRLLLGVGKKGRIGVLPPNGIKSISTLISKVKCRLEYRFYYHLIQTERMTRAFITWLHLS